ncbi:MAG: geranylgeranylglycerol-phosphate geranylgeranyltransferase [Candidatus Bathycorpusculaceae bacterium]
MNKLAGFIRLMRLANCLMMGFAVVVGAALASKALSTSFLPSLFYGFFTGFLLTAASMAINDYYDREIDAVNEPNRPIPSGTTKPKEALAFAFILSLLGFATAFANSYLTSLESVYCFLIAIIAWLIFVAYTTIGKRSGLPGNFLVSACVSIPFIYGSFAVTNTLEPNILIFVLMVFLSNTGREITKGIVDVQGDKMRGVKTLAVKYGEGKAAVAAALFYVSAVLLSPIPLVLQLVSFWFVPFVLVTDLGLVLSSIALIRDYSRENARKIKNSVLLWFMSGLLAFVFGVFW